MRKKLCVLMAALAVFAASCSSSEVNDAETGEIAVGENKYKYTDGTYTAYYDYYDQKGECCAMRVTVEGGVIVAISFDSYDRLYSRLSLNTEAELAEEVQLFKSEVKALNASVLQYQHYSHISPGETGSLASQYYSLMVNIIRMASSDSAKRIQAVSSVRKYTLKSEADAEGVSSHLSVSFSGEFVSDISFYQTDLYGLKLSDFFESNTDISYDDEIKTLCTVKAQSPSPVKENAENISPELLNIYNSLCEEIMLMRVPFEIENAHFSSVR